MPRSLIRIMPCVSFFATASQQAWFRNTLFVITPDHCSPQGSDGYYYGGIGGFAIPVLFYAPGDAALTGKINAPVQQLDILPSVLDYLHYDKPFFAFWQYYFPGGCSALCGEPEQWQLSMDPEWLFAAPPMKYCPKACFFSPRIVFVRIIF